MQGISLHELRLAIISILLYEAGRLLVFWWYGSEFPKGELEGSCQKPLRKPGKLKLKDGRPCVKPTVRGLDKASVLDNISSWYGSKAGDNIQTSFFGGVMEYWRCFETDSGNIVMAKRLRDQCTEGELEDIQGLGIRHSNRHGIFSASTFDCRPAVTSDHLFVDSPTARVFWKTFRSPSGLPLLDPSDLPDHFESLQGIAGTHKVVYSEVGSICGIIL